MGQTERSRSGVSTGRGQLRREHFLGLAMKRNPYDTPKRTRGVGRQETKNPAPSQEGLFGTPFKARVRQDPDHGDKDGRSLWTQGKGRERVGAQGHTAPGSPDPFESLRDAQRLGAELRSQTESVIGPIRTRGTSRCKAPNDGVSSSDMLGRTCVLVEPPIQCHFCFAVASHTRFLQHTVRCLVRSLRASRNHGSASLILKRPPY